MANKVNNFDVSKTVREFLSNRLTDNKTLYINKAGLNNTPVFQQVYNVDVIWDGGSYYLAYTIEDTDAAEVYINQLDMVLPAKLV